MHILSAALKNFRCFTSLEVPFNKNLVLIEGPNGSGKTSLLESLHYACYLRSFKTRTTRDLVNFGASAFSIKLQIDNNNGLPISITAGYSPEQGKQSKRLIKINDAPLKSYKELITLYRVIAMTDEDMLLIKGAPEVRRAFLDQAIMLIDPDYPVLLRKYLSILEQRNALLVASRLDYDSYQLWTEQLLAITQAVRLKRQEVLIALEQRLNNLIALFFDREQLKVQLTYKPKEILQHDMNTLRMEQAARRTLFGAHLDDYVTLLSQKSSRVYASRGQQKLLAMLLKVAQPATQHPQSCVFLLDDVVSDLDHERLDRFFKLLTSYQTQILITSPIPHAPLQEICTRYDYERIALPAY